MTSPFFEFSPLSPAGLTLIRRRPVEDERGYFSRFFCDAEFRALGLDQPIRQMNLSFTRRKGALRGLHFQYPPCAETKIVSCLQGEVFDVAVDLRAGSPTFLVWRGEILSAANRCSLLIPEGFAHGFQTLAADCELLYLHTAAYAPASEGGLNVRDPRLDIRWPLPLADISRRDQDFPFITADFQGIVL